MTWRDVALTLFLMAMIALVLAPGFPPRRRRTVRQPVPLDPHRPYQAYTREFDVEVDANGLESFFAALGDDERRLSERYPPLDPAPLFALDEELAARRANACAASAPMRADDAAVTLLIDHSGSMRGDPILHAARAALVASDLLARVGATQEVLGFTTTRWRGGRSREKWLKNGQPSYPGRLNDLLHIVYCRAGETLTAAQCAPMLWPGLLKENVDGEAVAWAVARLRQRREPRKYLIILSDGAPVDDSTILENGNGYLSQHLRAVIAEIEREGDILVAAIGIGDHVAQHYRRCVTIGSPAEWEEALVQLIERLLQGSFGDNLPSP
ncbi:Hypothetical protein; putative Cobalamin biosynthesis protein cobT (fragment) [Bradyrhizobium sp. ORS 278]|uniref:cobaltochelatase CobT-related protein n=1 Tax=Bradyrhizobium sp. (strain ORS 278) TaxID=114615 RepID=UPI0001507981